jgi:hypothetical protein
MQAEQIVNEDATVEISVEQLNYGKLAIAGKSLRIPTSEGYGVTRRSRGLDESRDNSLLPLRLMNVRRLERGLIDEKFISRGGLLVRSAQGWGGSPAPIALMRARFRPEDGEKGHGRLYQQTATWAVDFSVWRRHPAALLAVAGAKLQAQPDALQESAANRLECEPLRLHIADCGRSPTLEEMALPGVVRILSMFMSAAGDARDRSMTFGEGGDFQDEAGFLAAAGVALQLLPESYPRWRDISIVSGLRCQLPGLVIRYLPSPAQSARAAA